MSTNAITGQPVEYRYQRSERTSSTRPASRQDDAELLNQAARTGASAAVAAPAAETAGAAEGAEAANGVDPRRVDTYQPENPQKTTYKVDMDTVLQMKAETEARMSQLVEQTLSRQYTGGRSSKIFDLLRSGKYSMEDVMQARRDVSETGYWGVEQTSDRIVKMAQALTGGDPSKLDSMVKAFEKGYKRAEKAMGGSLTGISQRTREATLNKFQAVREQNQRTQAADQTQRVRQTEQTQQVQNQQGEVQREQTRTGAAAAAAGVT